MSALIANVGQQSRCITGQWKLNKSNPYAVGVRRVVMPSTDCIDNVANLAYTKSGSTEVITAHGVGRNYAAATTENPTDGIIVPSWTDTTGQASVLILQVRSGTGNCGWHALGNEIVSSKSHWPWSNLFYSSAFSTSRWIDSVSIPAGKDITKPHVVGISCKSGTKIATWDELDFVSSSNTDFALPTNFKLLGCDWTTSFDGAVMLAVFWDRALSAQELKTLAINPWQLFEPVNEQFYIIGDSSVTGSLSTTNSNDTLASSGSTTIVASLAKTNSNDTSTASGSPIVIGTLANTNSNDTLASSGTTVVTGSLAKTNSNDTVAASGTTLVTGTVSAQNANDTLVASGEIIGVISGSLSTTNSNDSLSSVGSPIIVATLATTNANDSSTASGSVPSTGTLAYSNSNDTVVASGTVTGTVNLTPQDLLDIADAVWAHSSAVHFELLLTEAWGRLGLDPTAPLISGQTQISFGSVVMALTQSSGNVTATRQ